MLTKVPRTRLTWTREAGPYFGNELMTFSAAGRLAVVELAKTRAGAANPACGWSSGSRCPAAERRSAVAAGRNDRPARS